MEKKGGNKVQGRIDPQSGLPVPSSVLEEKKEVKSSGWTVVETYFGKNPKGSIQGGLGEDGLYLGRLDRYVEVPRDENTGKPLIEGRFLSSRDPRSKERAVSRGFKPLKVKEGKLDPNGAPVSVGGMPLYIRPTEVGDAIRKAKVERAMEAYRRASAENQAEELSRAFGIRAAEGTESRNLKK